MASSLEKALRAEVASLERELERSGIFRRLQIVRRALSELGGGSAPSRRAPAARPRRADRTRGAGIGGELSIPQAARKALEAAGQPRPVRDLLADMAKLGKTVGGKKPPLNLTMTLSKDKDFESVRWAGSAAWWIKGKPLPKKS